MSVYIPIIPILWVVAIWAGIGLALYIPLDLWLTSKLVKANMGMRKNGPMHSFKRMVTHPVDTAKYLALWPVALFQIWKA